MPYFVKKLKCELNILHLPLMVCFSIALQSSDHFLGHFDHKQCQSHFSYFCLLVLLYIESNLMNHFTLLNHGYNQSQKQLNFPYFNNFVDNFNLPISKIIPPLHMILMENTRVQIKSLFLLRNIISVYFIFQINHFPLMFYLVIINLSFTCQLHILRNVIVVMFAKVSVFYFFLLQAEFFDRLLAENLSIFLLLLVKYRIYYLLDYQLSFSA